MCTYAGEALPAVLGSLPLTGAEFGRFGLAAAAQTRYKLQSFITLNREVACHDACARTLGRRRLLVLLRQSCAVEQVGLPDHDELVPASRGEELAVGAEVGHGHAAVMPTHREEQPALAQVPDLTRCRAEECKHNTYIRESEGL